MSSIQPLCLLLGTDLDQLPKEKLLFLEAEMFVRICENLMEIFKEKNKEYLRLMKINLKKENNMLEVDFIRCIINDILVTEEYTLTGIATYTDTPEEVIYDLAIGRNNNPTFLLSRKIIELHRTVRPGLYEELVNKIKPLSSSVAA